MAQAGVKIVAGGFEVAAMSLHMRANPGPHRHHQRQRGEAFQQLGAKVATHQDLSGLFLVRAVERYLKIGGRFAFVMPNAAVDRGQYKGLRTGRYKVPGAKNPVAIAFDPMKGSRVKELAANFDIVLGFTPEA